MPASCETALQQRCQQIVTSPVLTPEQKRHFLALEAENAPALSPPCRKMPARRWMKVSFAICLRGTPPFKPRYVLPDYGPISG
ncbi:putative PFL-like glycyl radical enzyme [Salmonella enterica subsp. enterica]|nr:putative PFL-like glycyl radical enzyme [Salmonella enterica subsp. enterica]